MQASVFSFPAQLFRKLARAFRETLFPPSITLFGARANVIACDPLTATPFEPESEKRYLLDALIRPAHTGDAWAPEELELLPAGSWTNENRPRVLDARVIEKRRFVPAAGRLVRGACRIRLEVAVGHTRTPLRFVHRDAVFGEVSLPKG
jgi:hypothetical protein